MIRDRLIAALRGTEVFAGASDATLGRIAERMRERRFDPGQLLFARGDAGDRLYFIVSGRLRLSVVKSPCWMAAPARRTRRRLMPS
jgi:CRP-like cAMP-binding protein